MSVILLEAAHSGQPGQRSRQLVSVEDPEIRQPQGELPPRARPVTEHQTAGRHGATRDALKTFPGGGGHFEVRDLNPPVAGAVHGLQREDVALHGEGEHVLAVVLPVAGCLPQLAVEDVGGGYFLKASPPVLLLEKKKRRRVVYTFVFIKPFSVQLSCKDVQLAIKQGGG